jgi:hypothetical protein
VFCHLRGLATGTRPSPYPTNLTIAVCRAVLSDGMLGVLFWCRYCIWRNGVVLGADHRA